MGGSVFRFVMEYEHVDFPAAVRKLGARVGIPVIEERASESDDRQYEARRVLLKLHAEGAEWFHNNLLRKEFAEPAREYLKQRGIDRQVAKNWQLGFAPEAWDEFLKWALSRGYSRNQLLQGGLVKLRDENRPESEVYDRFRGRVMFPICNDVGEVVAFSGRLLGGNAEAAKYLNSPETPIFRKGNLLFGLHKTKRSLIEADCGIVCEGQLDLIALYETGITNVVAPQGTAFTEPQARILKRYVNEVVLCFDADEAGQKAAERSLDALLQNDLIVRVVEMPAGRDPDSLIRRDGREEFEKRVAAARDFFDYWIDREVGLVDLSSLGAKMQLARKMADVIGRVNDASIRKEVIYKASARLGLSPVDFENLVPKPARRQPADVPGDMDSSVPVQAIKQLCVLALRDPDARKFLLSQKWREVVAETPGAELLGRILNANIDVEDPATLNAFLASLEPHEEAMLAEWIAPKRIPYTDRNIVHQWWFGLEAEGVKRKLEALNNQMRMPELNTGDLVNLQKQILDLREQLHEISALSSAPGAER